MRSMGDKVSARKLMSAAGVPILPGTGVIKNNRDAEEAIERMRLRVIIKASAGGGGRGMKSSKTSIACRPSSPRRAPRRGPAGQPAA